MLGSSLGHFGGLGGHFGSLGVHVGDQGLAWRLRGRPLEVRGELVFICDVFGIAPGGDLGVLWVSFLCFFSGVVVSEWEVGVLTFFLDFVGGEGADRSGFLLLC